MGDPVLILDAKGLNTQPNELRVPAGSLAVAENVEVTRDGVVQVSPGFADYSSNLPDFLPEQLLGVGGQLYAFVDNGWWYHDGSNWLRKRGSLGAKATQPVGLAIQSGHLYFSANHCIWDINLSTGARSILAGRFGVSGSTDATGGAARFNTPGGICSDGTNLYVCDINNFTVRKIVISSAVVTTLAGTAGANGSTDGTGAAARFELPKFICTPDNTNLYLSDQTNHTIRKIVISSAVVTTLAGTAGATGSTDATGSSARFNQPQGICSDGTNLYVCDSVNHTIRKIVISSAVVTTLAGTAGANGSTDATGSSARFKTPIGICTDNTNLYLTDGNNFTIRKIVISSAVVTTLAGTALSNGSSDGISSAARFDVAYGILYDGANVVVCDYTNYLLRKLYLSSNYVTTISGVVGNAGIDPGAVFADGIFTGPS